VKKVLINVTTVYDLGTVPPAPVFSPANESAKSRGIRKQTTLESISPRILKIRFAKSNELLTQTLTRVREIHGYNVAASVVAQFLAQKEPEAFFHHLVNSYKDGYLARVTERKQKLAVKAHFGDGDVVHLVDRCSGVNVTGMCEVLKELRPCLPEGALPTKLFARPRSVGHWLCLQPSFNSLKNEMTPS
jgi:hypothetical protein